MQLDEQQWVNLSQQRGRAAYDFPFRALHVDLQDCRRPPAAPPLVVERAELDRGGAMLLVACGLREPERVLGHPARLHTIADPADAHLGAVGEPIDREELARIVGQRDRRLEQHGAPPRAECAVNEREQPAMCAAIVQQRITRQRRGGVV